MWQDAALHEGTLMAIYQDGYVYTKSCKQLGHAIHQIGPRFYPL